MVVGREVDGYHIQAVLGKGGMGVVYKAEDVALSRSVALKRIAPSFANDKSFLRRFRSEAQALARIDSPYIVSVHALRKTEIGLLIVMEYVDGGTLRDMMDEGPMDWHEALPLIKQTLQALEHAHRAEVIHRDIKPSNVMLSAEGTVKVTDFGLAKVHRGDSKATVTQGVHGTLNYMSPEQVKGDANLDHRSDLYSLGMTVYEMLAGELPFEDSSAFSKMRTIVEEELPRPDAFRPQVPEGVSALVMRALEKDPDDRFQSAEAMLEAVAATGTQQEEATNSNAADVAPVAQPSTVGRSRARVTGAGLLVLLLTVGGYLMYDMMMAGTGESDGDGAVAPPSPTPTTALSVETRPTGANVYLDRRLIGITPLDDTVEGDSAQLRVQKAGFVPLDTTFGLGNEQTVDLNIQLPRDVSQTALTVSTEPSGATVYLDGDSIGASPLSSTVDGNAATVRVQKDGYVPVDTALQLTDAQQTRLGLQLKEAEPDDPQAAHGAYHLSVTPTGTVIVDGQTYGRSASVELPVGRHEVQFRHPEHGSMDTTITVRDGQKHELTGYFEHTIRVLSPEGRGNVYLSGTNTEALPPYTLSRGPGTYRVGLQILQDASQTISGGTYRKMVNNRQVESAEFSRTKKDITIEPSFAPETHVVTFRVRNYLERVRSKTDRLKRDIKRAIQEQDWEILPAPLATSCKQALSALYSKHEIETVRVISNEMSRKGPDVELPFDIYITYHQKGREGTKAIPLSLITRWGNQNGTMKLVDVRRTDM